MPLVDVDIGANDVDGCATASNVGQCVTNGLDTIGNNVPKIFASLKNAAPAGTTFAAMNLYDPILGGYFAPAETTAHGLATASVTLAKEVNGALTKADNRGGFQTADVADAFDTYNGTSDGQVGGPADPAQRRANVAAGPGPARRRPADQTSTRTRTAIR